MFDISWSEFLLIGIVALVVIGPKELPAVMRTLGQWTRKVRSMAADFQNQFQEAMREAEMTDLKKQVDDMARDVADFDPLKGVREDIASVGSEMQQSLSTPAEQTLAVADASAEAALPAPPAEASPDGLPAPHDEAATPTPAPAATPAADEPTAPTPAADTPHAEAAAAPTPPADAPHAEAEAEAVPADSVARA
jgi:sec-independent protein translocase protein TatB